MTPWRDKTDNRGTAVKVTLCLGGCADIICIKKNYIIHYMIHESPSCQWTLLRWGKCLMVFFCLHHAEDNVISKHTDLELCPLWCHKGRVYYALCIVFVFLETRKVQLRISFSLLPWSDSAGGCKQNAKYPHFWRSIEVFWETDIAWLRHWSVK